MIALGTAPLVETTNSAGYKVKAYDLRPFGGDLLHLGLVGSPLPSGTTDRTIPGKGVLRIDLGNGAVFQVTAEDPEPTVGEKGGTVMTPRRTIPPLVLAIAAGVALAFFRKKRR